MGSWANPTHTTGNPAGVRWATQVSTAQFFGPPAPYPLLQAAGYRVPLLRVLLLLLHKRARLLLALALALAAG